MLLFQEEYNLPFGKLQYNQGKIIFDVKITNDDGSFLEDWKFGQDNFDSWQKIMKKKFGLKLDKLETKELDWAY